MLWDSIKTSMASLLSKSEFELWIQPISCLAQNREGVTLAGPDRFFCAWVEERYLGLIKQKSLELGGSGTVCLQVAASTVEDESYEMTAKGSLGQMRLPGAPRRNMRLRSLHPAFTFEQFMVGESNRLAHSACEALAKGDYTFGRCLFMDSSTGLGKSHLTQAVVHKILRTAPSTRLQYLTAQQFSAEMVKGIRSNTMEQFSQKYIGDCDILLLEDVHTLSGRTKTQEEFNNVLDYLLKTGRRVILTSAMGPDKIKDLDTDVCSRMRSGLLASIEAPDFDTRVRIIQHKMAAQGLVAENNLAEYLAEGLEGDIRRMESAVMGIKAKSCLLHCAPDMEMVREVLRSLGGIAAVTELSAEAICGFIGNRFKVSRDDLRSRSRKRAIVFPRQLAMYLTRKFTEHSLAEIGGLYNRDHSTVLHSIKAITQQISHNTSVREQVSFCENTLKKGNS